MVRNVGIVVGVLACAVFGDELWRQQGDGRSIKGPSYRWEPRGEDQELADDFVLDARIEQVRVGGSSYPDPDFRGLYIRFYALGQDGSPGALEREYFLGANDRNLDYDPNSPTWYLATLVPAFEAAGRHYLAVQPVIDPGWWWASANTGSPRGEAFYYRDNAAEEGWAHGDAYPYDDDHSDLNFTLYGVLTGGPRIESLGDDTLPRSGRLRIFGGNFGNERGDAFVTIDGQTAWTTTWSDVKIVAYVPESATPGNVEVQVHTPVGESDSASLTVTPRQRDGRVRWTFEADSRSLWFRPALAPDGMIYLHGSEGFVYALSPDGGLKWTQQVNWYPYAPPTAGPDGTLYVGSIGSVFAISPEGQILWQFDDAGAQAVQIVPTIGPDGHLYGAFDPGDPGLGAYSLTTGGGFRWNNIGSPPMLEYGGTGAEMRFGPSRAGGPIDQLYVGMDRRGDNHLYAFSLGGAQRWAIPVGPNGAGAQPVIGADGTVYSTDFIAAGYGWVIRAFDPGDGSSRWLYDGDFISGLSHLEIGPDDALYYTADLGYLEALDPDTQTLRWSNFTGAVMGSPSVAPDGSMLVCSGVPNFGDPGFIKGFDTERGAELWSVALPGEFYPEPRWLATHRPRFTPDARTAYVSTVTVGGDDDDPHSFLYALETGEGCIRDPQWQCDGDVDGDGQVNPVDSGLVQAAFGSADDQDLCNHDVDCDGQINPVDSGIVQSLFGTCEPPRGVCP